MVVVGKSRSVPERQACEGDFWNLSRCLMIIYWIVCINDKIYSETSALN